MTAAAASGKPISTSLASTAILLLSTGAAHSTAASAAAARSRDRMPPAMRALFDAAAQQQAVDSLQSVLGNIDGVLKLLALGATPADAFVAAGEAGIHVSCETFAVCSLSADSNDQPANQGVCPAPVLTRHTHTAPTLPGIRGRTPRHSPAIHPGCRGLGGKQRRRRQCSGRGAQRRRRWSDRQPRGQLHICRRLWGRGHAAVQLRDADGGDPVFRGGARRASVLDRSRGSG